MATPSAIALAQDLARVADLKKSEAILILDVSAQHSLIDCFVIATARSDKHAKVVGEDALAFVKGKGQQPWHLEASSEWICGDFGDVVLHVFTPEARDFYALEHLWADAEPIQWTPAPRPDTIPA